jgi:hypothetical protein
MPSIRTNEPSFICPSRLYSRRGTILESGLSATRIREARQQGIEIPWLIVGKRKYVRGSDLIAYIERLAAL